MSKLALIIVIAVISVLASGSAFAAQSNSFTKFLNDMDRKVCHSFKATCKARTTKRQKPIESPSTPAANETNATKPASPPPIPVQKPVLAPKVAASAPIKAADAPPSPPQKLAIAAEEPAPAPIPREKPHKPQQQAALLLRVMPKPSPPSDDNETCQQKLRSMGVDFTVPAVNVDTGQCHVQNPVNLHRVRTHGSWVALPDGPLLNCKFALQFSKWIKESGAPILAAQLGSPLKNISTGPGFECRGRNGDSTAKISEHGFGNAVDIATLRMANGKVLNVENAIDSDGGDSAVWHGLRTSACGYFATVLGPGSNAAHEKHFHFDLGQHGKSGNYRICE